MILDNETIFSKDQAITATAPSTNVYDFGEDKGVLGGSAEASVEKGNSPIFVHISEAFNNATSIQFDLETDDDEAFGSAKVLQSKTVLLADLAAGASISGFMVPEGAERYLRFNYTVTGSAPTTGKIFAGIVLDKHTNVSS